MKTKTDQKKSFIRRHKILRALMPGIRVKLAFLTGLFVSLILLGGTVFNYINQTQILEEGFAKETASSLRFINSVVTDMENSRTNILLVEDMRIRIEEKQNELKKYKTVMYQKKQSVGNTFRSIGKSLGFNVHFEYTPQSVDSYYSIYLSEKEIKAIEKAIMTGLRLNDGKEISEKDFRVIQKYARVVAQSQRTLNTISDSIARNRDTLSSLPTDGAKTAASEIARLKREIRSLEIKESSEKKRTIAADNRLRGKLKTYFEYSLDRLEEIGAQSDNIRIMTFNKNGESTYDTAGRNREMVLRFASLENNPTFVNDKQAFFAAIESAPDAREVFTREYRDTNDAYHVRYAPIYRNPDTFERAGIVIDEISARTSDWKAYLYEDLRISKLISGAATALRLRRSELMQKKTAPSDDPTFRNLYQKYRSLVDERDKSFARVNPHKNEPGAIRARYDLLITKNVNDIKTLNEKIAQLKSAGQKDADPAEIKDGIESFNDQIEKLQKDTAMLKIDRSKSSEEIGLSDKLTAADAIHYLRNAALYDFIALRQKTDFMGYREYLKSSQTRATAERRWNAIREWIYAGGSETILPEFLSGSKNIRTIENGILSFSRSEAEEFMWKLDSTPLAQESGLFGIRSAAEALPGDLLERNVTGYNAVLIDKTREEKKITERGKTMLIYSGLIAALAIILTYFLSGFAIRRIGIIIRRTTSVRDGDLDVQFPEKGLDEIEELGISLNGMIIGLREKEKLKGELAAASQIQKQLLPETIPATLDTKYSIGTLYRSMRGVGGDYYDFIEIAKDRLLFCIGDVSSHGVGPAIVMAMVSSHLHGIVRRGETNLTKILLELNKQIFLETPSYMFVTFFIGIIDGNTNMIEYSSAGHIKPLLYRYKDNIVETLDGGGLPIGMDDNDFFEGTIETRSIKVQPGDLFFQYTDGANEAMNDKREQFGNERIISTILKFARKKPDVMIAQIAEAIQQFTGKDLSAPGGVTELNDDIAMLAIKRIR